MDKILVDTNILIDYSKGKNGILGNLLNKQQKEMAVLYINPVIIAEYLTDDNLKEGEKNKLALEFINFFSIYQLGKKEGILAGRLMRENVVNFIGDAFIAASCVIGGLKLATKNKKHFLKVQNLKLL